LDILWIGTVEKSILRAFGWGANKLITAATGSKKPIVAHCPWANVPPEALSNIAKLDEHSKEMPAVFAQAKDNVIFYNGQVENMVGKAMTYDKSFFRQELLPKIRKLVKKNGLSTQTPTTSPLAGATAAR
jgi:hypothetical protein